MADRKRGSSPGCHPERKHHARGMCAACYFTHLGPSIAARYRGTAAYREYGAKYARTRRDRIDALKNKPCADCGGRFPPVCMDFDHRDPTIKFAGIGNMRSYSMERVEAEIAKCDLVCANCHRIRTYSCGG